MELIADALVGLTRGLIGAHPIYQAGVPGARQTIYFANHSSHIDALALWSALPAAARSHTRAVAARDYWGKSALRRMLAINGLHAVLVDRLHEDPEHDPLEPLRDALRQGDSLIIFPEGTRGCGAGLAAFKSGLYWLAAEFPDVEIVPAYLDNLHRCLPKGASVPVPIVCHVHFGAPMLRRVGEDKTAFLARARQSLLELS